MNSGKSCVQTIRRESGVGGKKREITSGSELNVGSLSWAGTVMTIVKENHQATLCTLLIEVAGE